MKIILEGNLINSLDDFYNQIEKPLILSKCPWGRNLDSLDEIILYNFNYTDNPSWNVREIIWNNSRVSAANLGLAETLKLKQRGLDAITSRPYQQWSAPEIEHEILLPQREISDEIERLRRGESQTLFEVLTGILSSNKDIKLTLN